MAYILYGNVDFELLYIGKMAATQCGAVLVLPASARFRPCPLQTWQRGRSLVL